MVRDDHHRTRAIVDDEGAEIAISRRNIFTFVTDIQDQTHRYANDYRKRAMRKVLPPHSRHSRRR